MLWWWYKDYTMYSPYKSPVGFLYHPERFPNGMGKAASA